MNDEAKKAKNAYQRKYRAEHPEKTVEYQTRYWNRKAAIETPEDSAGLTMRSQVSGIIPVGYANAMTKKELMEKYSIGNDNEFRNAVLASQRQCGVWTVLEVNGKYFIPENGKEFEKYFVQSRNCFPEIEYR